MPGEISITSRWADDTTLVAESKEELKSLLIRVKEESEKVGLKFNIKKSKIVALGPLTSWQREGKKVETVTNFLFLGFKITADNDCSYEIRRYSILGMKIMTNLDSALKSRHHFANKGPHSQSHGLSSSHAWI